MPKLKTQVPAYRHHRASGQAIVHLDGQDFYLGAYGSDASQQEYQRLIGLWSLNGRRLPQSAPAHAAYSINELCLDYLTFAET